MNNVIKKILVLLVICSVTLSAKAQLGYDYAQYDLGIGLDLNKAYTDAQTVVGTKSAHFNFNYNVGPFLNTIYR